MALAFSLYKDRILLDSLKNDCNLATVLCKPDIKRRNILTFVFKGPKQTKIKDSQKGWLLSCYEPTVLTSDHSHMQPRSQGSLPHLF